MKGLVNELRGNLIFDPGLHVQLAGPAGVDGFLTQFT